MAVLTEIVIAELEEATSVAEAFEPSRKWNGMDAKGHNDLTLGCLFNIFRGEDPYVDVLGDFKQVASKSDSQGPWVFLLPEQLLEYVISSSETDLEIAVARWLEVDEMSDANMEYAMDFIYRLKGLAIESRSEEKKLLMWISL